MPKMFDWRGYRFHFYANEGDPREPAHIHVTRERDTAKFWLRPGVALAYNRGFSPRVLSQIEAVIIERADEIEGAWHDFFG